MTDWIEKVTIAICYGIAKALSSPGVMVGLVRAWRQANDPEQVIASKPNQTDDNFLRKAQNDGWANVPAADKRLQQHKYGGVSWSRNLKDGPAQRNH